MKEDKKWMILFLFFIIGFSIRLPFLLLSTKGVNSDIAMTGLMGIHILRGDFPIFWWGQGYMGPLDSYLNAVITYIFGLSNINSMIIPFLFSLFFPFITYLLAKEIFGEKEAIPSFIFASLPTVFFVILLKGEYMITVFIGSLLILLTVQLLKERDLKPVHEILYREKEYRRHILLGFLGGLGFWINFLILPYLATVGLFLFLRDRLFFLKKPFFLFLLSFLLGSLPFWIFNLTHDFWTLALLHGAGQRNPFLAAKVLIKDNIPLFLGLKYTEYPWSLFTALPGVIYGIIFVSLLIGIFRLKDKKGVSVLIVFTLLVCISFILSRWGALGSPRYLFPLYSVIPIAIAFSLSVLRERSRILCYILGAVVITANLYAAVDAYSWARKPSERDPDTEGLIHLLESKGIRHAYSDYTLAPRLTFESKERIICAEPTTERYPGYRETVNASSNFAYIYRLKGNPFEIAFFGDNLKATGIDYRSDDIDAFRVFHSFSPPSPEIEIPREGWRVESNLRGEDAHKAIDGDVWTRWASKEPKKEGMWFMIDMGKSYSLSGISLLPGNNPADSMVGYLIESSLDKNHWIPIASLDRSLSGIYWARGGPRFDDSGRLKISFKPITARYIRINHKGNHPIFDWSIAEVFLFKGYSKDPGAEGSYKKNIEEGRSFEDKGEYGNAMRRYFDAIRLYGDIEEAYHRLMVLGQRLNIPEGPSYRRGVVFERYGLVEKAIEDYEKILLSSSYSSEVIRRLMALKKSEGDILNRLRPSERREIAFGDRIEFMGYDLEKKEINRGEAFHMTFYWKAIRRIEKDWTVFVHFLDPEGNRAFQIDHLLYAGYNNSRDWVKGEIYREGFEIKVPEDLRPGGYKIKIGLWDTKTGERLKADVGKLKKRDEIVIGEIGITDE